MNGISLLAAKVLPVPVLPDLFLFSNKSGHMHAGGHSQDQHCNIKLNHFGLFSSSPGTGGIESNALPSIQAPYSRLPTFPPEICIFLKKT